MTFREKSAWLMMVITLFVGGYMALEVGLTFLAQQHAPPVLPLFIGLTVSLISLSIVGQIVLTVVSRQEAELRPDEREKKIVSRAQSIAGLFLSFGIVVSLVLYLFQNDGNALFYACLFSLVVAQLAEYSAQIVCFRRSE